MKSMSCWKRTTANRCWSRRMNGILIGESPRLQGPKNVIAAIGALLSGITLARGLSEAREISEPDPHFEARARKYARENFFAGLNNPDPQIQNAALDELKQKKDPAFWVDTDEAMMKELGADPREMVSTLINYALAHSRGSDEQKKAVEALRYAAADEMVSSRLREETQTALAILRTSDDVDVQALRNKLAVLQDLTEQSYPGALIQWKRDYSRTLEQAFQDFAARQRSAFGWGIAEWIGIPAFLALAAGLLYRFLPPRSRNRPPPAVETERSA